MKIDKVNIIQIKNSDTMLVQYHMKIEPIKKLNARFILQIN
ncbi:hypothetical protein ES705_25914 [subsurface metagenome]